MKKQKKQKLQTFLIMPHIVKLTLLFLVTVLVYSCSSGTNEVATECEINGPVLVCPGEIATYTFDSDISNPIVTWNPMDGIALLTQNGTTATFKFPNNFAGGSIGAIGDGNEVCSETIDVELDPNCGPPPPPLCECPVPVIDDVLCVSGGHPHWRFEVTGVSASDQITWSINHGTIHNGVNNEYAIIEPNAGSTAGFTVQCKVVRNCVDGSTRERIAYYTNYYGNDCGTGTTGYIGSCPLP